MSTDHEKVKDPLPTRPPMTTSTNTPDPQRGPGKAPEQLAWMHRIDWDHVNRALNAPRTPPGGTR